MNDRVVIDMCVGWCVLVMGGVGFFGSYVCEWFVMEGVFVICVDSLLMGCKFNVVDLKVFGWFEFVKGDVLFGLLQLQVDEIWNFVCVVFLFIYQIDLVYMMMMNVFGMNYCFVLVCWIGVCVFQVLISEIYGDFGVYLQMEIYCGNVNMIGLCVCYDEGKCVVEVLCYDYYCLYGVDVCVVCIFNIYGLCMLLCDGCVVLNFIVVVFNGVVFEIYGDGWQMCLFCFVSDLIDGFFSLMDVLCNVGILVNIGNFGEFMMIEFVE